MSRARAGSYREAAPEPGPGPAADMAAAPALPPAAGTERGAGSGVTACPDRGGAEGAAGLRELS